MTEDADGLEGQLLDARLGKLSAGEAARLQEQVAASPELVRKDKLLGDLLALLDRDEVVHPSVDLAAAIIRQTGPLSVSRHEPTEEAAALPSGAEVGGIGRGWGLRDVFALAACIALMFMLGVPGYRKAQQLSQRSVCLDNLREIGRGTQAYAQANSGFLPFANYIPGGSWMPVQQAGLPQASNSRHIFRLTVGGQTSNFRVFVCPSAPNGRPLQAAETRQLLDFPDPANNSYSFIFMNRPVGRRLEDLRTDNYRQMVLAADRNPHFSNEPACAASVLRESNSPWHEKGAGQNAIYVDGSGGWFRRPAIGVDGDDIYRAGMLTHYQGTEEPLYETDSFLP